MILFLWFKYLVLLLKSIVQLFYELNIKEIQLFLFILNLHHTNILLFFMVVIFLDSVFWQNGIHYSLNIQVIVFKSDEGIKLQPILINLIMRGVWSCFNEFNQLNDEDQSVIFQQIQVIHTSVIENATNAELMWRHINVTQFHVH